MHAGKMMRQDLVANYRQHAANCIEIAQHLSDSQAKLVLLNMAQSWLALAEQAVKNSETVLVYETPIPKPAVIS
jgi:NADPH:quinone reductase-like Zn-dependent oxidoreductase